MTTPQVRADQGEAELTTAVERAIADVEAAISRQEVVEGEGIAVVRCQGVRIILSALAEARAEVERLKAHVWVR